MDYLEESDIEKILNRQTQALFKSQTVMYEAMILNDDEEVDSDEPDHFM